MNTLQVSPESCSTEGLSFLWLEITVKCNLECVHCYADSGPKRQLFGELGLNDWLTILQDAAGIGCRQVQFIGGEPTLHPDLSRMISFASAQDYGFIEVYTNAIHIDDQMLQVFRQCGVKVAVSFYSDNAETHDAITRRRGSFERTVANLHRLLRAELPVRAGIIEMQENQGHGERAREFLEKVGVIDTKVDFQRGIGRAAKAADGSDPMNELCGECWKGKLCVTSSGSAYPCVFSRFAKVGAVRDGISSIVNDERLANFRHALKNQQNKMPTKEGQRESAGCEPNCSPCSPSVFKCVPASCAPRRAGHTHEQIDDLKVGGPTPVVGHPASSSADLGCNPTCAPTTCSPCAPGVFRCAPGATNGSLGQAPGTNGSTGS